jgi:hypothetical protein
MIGALITGVLGLVVALLLSQPWVAVGLCVGLALGIGNFRLIVLSVLRAGRRAGTNKRRPLAMNTLSRLMVLTVVCLAIAWFKFALGAGIIGGLAVFQFLLLFNVARAMLKAGVGGGPGAGSLLMGLTGGLSMDNDGDVGDGDDPAALPAAVDGASEDRGVA